MVKSLKDISWLVDEPTYRADEAYSYSTLAKFHREGFDKIDSLFDKVDSPSLLFGSMVDTLLTDGEEAFDKLFFIAEFPEVSDSIKKIVTTAFDTYKNQLIDFSEIPSNVLLSIINSVGYQPRWRDKTRIDDVVSKGSEYFHLLYLSGDKKIVNRDTYEDAIECVNALKSSNATKYYFEQDNPFEPDIERLYQLKFKGEYNGIKLRCMMDEVIVDHKNKIIIPIDLKTSYKPEHRFYKSFIEWCYYIQAQLYAELLRQNIEKDDYFKDFKIMNYRFIVVSNETRNPLVWEFPLTFSDKNEVVNGVEMKNWRNIVNELNYYLKERPRVPKGIVRTETNNLIDWIGK